MYFRSLPSLVQLHNIHIYSSTCTSVLNALLLVPSPTPFLPSQIIVALHVAAKTPRRLPLHSPLRRVVLNTDFEARVMRGVQPAVVRL